MKKSATMPPDGMPYYGQARDYAPYPPPAAAPAAPTWKTKAGYIATGVVIGLAVYPFVRRSLSRIQPGLDKFFDGLAGKAEGAVEMAADLLAKAKQNLREEASAAAASDAKTKGKSAPESHDHDHDHNDHDH